MQTRERAAQGERGGIVVVTFYARGGSLARQGIATRRIVLVSFSFLFTFTVFHGT
jgi:hypothetical protein